MYVLDRVNSGEFQSTRLTRNIHLIKTILAICRTLYTLLVLALTMSGLVVGRGKKVTFRGILRDKFAEKRLISGEIRGNFRDKFR